MRNKGSGFNGSDRNLKPVTRNHQPATSNEACLFLTPARRASESVEGRSYLRFFCFSFDVGRSTCPQCLWVVLVECPGVSTR